MGRSYFTPAGIQIPLDSLAVALAERSAFAANFSVAAGDSVQHIVDRASPGDTIYLGPGTRDEAVVIPRALSNLTVVGSGNRGACALAPTATNATALTIEADDCTIVNLVCDGAGTGAGLFNRGRRTRVMGSKIIGGTDGVKLTLGTVAQIGAATHGRGDDALFTDCEIANNTNGVKIAATDYGAVASARFRKCLFHDNSAADFAESGGVITTRFRDLDIGDSTFLRLADGTAPAAHILLNGDNANSGMVHGCTFGTALNGGKNLVSTALLWVANFHPAGLSTTQPS